MRSLVFAVAKLAESRDVEAGAHVERVQEYSRLLARELRTTDRFASVIDERFVKLISIASALHDIGMAAIPDQIMLKPGDLTPSEYEVMKTHTTLGARALREAMGRPFGGGVLGIGCEIAEAHHERWDGLGYPTGLSREKIPLAARIVAVADVYDAVTSKRVYKPAMSHEEAREVLTGGAGSEFDPHIIQAFTRLERVFQDVARRAAYAPLRAA